MKEIDFDKINDLYLDWLNERDPFIQRKRKEDIKSRVSKEELLIYSAKYSSPFEAFRNIFSLADLFETLEKMQKRGEDISHFTNQSLLIKSLEDIKIVSDFTKRETSPEISNFEVIFVGSNIFNYGDIKNIGRKFPYARANNLSLEQLEQMIKTQTDYKGVPITITIDNIGQLPLEKLNSIERFFDVIGVKIISKDKSGCAHQGECTPLNLRTYKQIRAVVDNEIIGKLYVSEKANKMNIDYQLATQIIDILANRIEYDHDATKKPRFSKESKYASGLVGLLTGKSICKGYSEILRNVLSCVDIECLVIDGIYSNDEDHSWNQVKLGNTWFNVDLTFARDKICKGEPSGDLFMSDSVFFGDRRKGTFDKGKEINGRKIERTAMIGGHSYGHKVKHQQCKECITPCLTSTLIERSRLYEEKYKREGKSADYKGVIPYVASSIEKMRSSISKEFDTFEYN